MTIIYLRESVLGTLRVVLGTFRTDSVECSWDLLEEYVEQIESTLSRLNIHTPPNL